VVERLETERPVLSHVTLLGNRQDIAAFGAERKKIWGKAGLGLEA